MKSIPPNFGGNSQPWYIQPILSTHGGKIVRETLTLPHHWTEAPLHYWNSHHAMSCHLHIKHHNKLFDVITISLVGGVVSTGGRRGDDCAAS